MKKSILIPMLLAQAAVLALAVLLPLRETARMSVKACIEGVRGIDAAACDYCFWTASGDRILRKDGRREAMLGDTQDGLHVDGEAATRYWQGEASPVEPPSLAEWDAEAAHLAGLVLRALETGAYTDTYTDLARQGTVKARYFVLLPGDWQSTCAAERVNLVCIFRKGVFQSFLLRFLRDADEERTCAEYDIGALIDLPLVRP